MKKFVFILSLIIGFNGNICAAADVILPAAYLFPWKFDENITVKKSPLDEVAGLLVPHHMIVRQKVYEAYRILSSNFPAPDTIFILSPNHYEEGKSDIQMNSTGFRTRFGTLEVDKTVENELGLTVNNFPFYREHGISAHVNFIKNYFPNAKVVPIIFKWNAPQKDLDALVRKLVKASQGRKTLIIASIDFSHYQTKEVADFHDLRSENVISRCDEKEVSKLEIDSHASLYVFLKTLKLNGMCDSALYSHTNSQDFARKRIAATTSHFVSFFGRPSQGEAYKLNAPEGATSISKINFVFSVIHSLTPNIAGVEDRFFMGNNKIYILKNGEVFGVSKTTKQVLEKIEDKIILNMIVEGEKVCAGKDFGVIKSKAGNVTACF